MLNGETVVRIWWLGVVGLGMAALGCGSSGGNTTSAVSVIETTNILTNTAPQLDLLFVVDDSSSAFGVQEKVNAQVPTFLNALTSLPTTLDLHVAVVTTDMGAPGDSTSSIMCTSGADGAFQNTPRAMNQLDVTCTSSGLQDGSAYFADDGKGNTNFTGPLSTDLQCVLPVGTSGCGFIQPLAALDHALGADNFQPDSNGNPVPSPRSSNSGFLRPDANLAIILVTAQDDCSAPQNTPLFSLNVGGSNQQNIMNALGPISKYRCNEFGHLCKDPTGGDPNALIEPSLNPPADHQGTAAVPTLDLTDCESNDTMSPLTTPVQHFVDDIKQLKADPDNQIVVAAITAPSSPYTVAWMPEENGQNTQPGELWPQVLESCGAKGDPNVNPEATQFATDGSAGAPAVRITQFVNAFPNSALTSVCDASYAQAIGAIATKVGALVSVPCLPGKIQVTNGLPECTVIAHLGNITDVTYQNCAITGNAAPCWSFGSDATCSGQTLNFVETTPSHSVTVTCSVCQPGVSMPGC